MISHPLTADDVRRIYAAELARLTAIHAETPQDQPLPLLAWRGTRTLIHEQIHQVHAPRPPRDPAHDDEHDHEAVVKPHNKAIWREVDSLVAAAGITEKGAT